MLEDWEELYSEKHKRKYWKNKKTGTTSWKDPSAEASASASEAPSRAPSLTGAGAPEDWEELFSDKHKRKYWRHRQSGRTSWVVPTADQSAAAAETKTADAKEPAAASEWVEAYNDKHKRKYWKNTVTGKTSWTPPSAEEVVEAKPVAAAPAADEWEELYNDKHKRKYWKHKATGKTSWTPPAAAPAVAAGSAATAAPAAAAAVTSEWEELYNDKHKRKYWKHKTTGKSTWTLPDELAAVAAPKPAEQPAATAAAANTASAEAKEEWVEAYNDKHKRKYWKNTVTGKTSWTPPAPAPSSAQPSAAAAVAPTPPSAPAAIEVPVVIPMQTVLRAVHLLISTGEERQLAMLTIDQVDATTVSLAIRSITGQSACAIAVRDWSKLNTFVHSLPVQKLFVGTSMTMTCQQVLSMLSIAADGSKESISMHSPLLARYVFQVMRSLLLGHKSMSADLDKRFLDAAGPADALVLSSKAEELKASIALHNALHDMVESEAVLAVSDAADILQTATEPDAQLLLQAQQRCESVLKEYANDGKDYINTDNENANMIPLSGIHVIQVSYAAASEGLEGLPPSAVPAASNWTPCWIQIDQSGRSIAFHEHGPSQPASFHVSCSAANLLLPDLTECKSEAVITLKHGLVDNALVDVSFQFKTIEELWRSALSLAALCDAVVGKYADASNRRGVDTMKRQLVRDMLDSRTLSFLSSACYCQDFILSVESMLADRLLCSDYIRYLHLTGAQLRSLKFQQANQRILITGRGSCPNVVEGSVLLSINGLSALQVPANTVMKFISEIPKQMNADIVLLKFPRAEFAVDVIDIESQVHGEVGELSAAISTAAATKYNSSQKKLDAESKHQLNRVLVKKRSSISLQLTPDQYKAETAAAAAAEDAVVAPAPAAPQVKPKETIKLDKFMTSELSEWTWAKQTITIANGRVVLCAANSVLEAGIKIPISALQLKLIFPKTGKSLSDICIMLSDGQAVRVLLRCPGLNIFQGIVRRLVIAMKLHNVMAVDLAWIYHQSEGWRKSKQHREGSSKRYTVSNPSLSSILSNINSLQPKSSPHTSTTVNISVLQAAEALDGILTSLHLPMNFPSPEIVSTFMKELIRSNKTNHQLLMDLLLAQYDQLKPVEAVTPSATSLAKTMHVIFPEANDDGLMGADFFDADEHDGSEDSTTRHNSVNRRGSRMSILNDLNHTNAPPPPPPASSAANASSNSNPQYLSSEEAGAVSVILTHFREHPEDFIHLSSKARMGQDLKTLAFLAVHRLYHPWSCDQYYLGQLILSLLASTAAPATAATAKFNSKSPLKNELDSLLPGLQSMRLTGALNQIDKSAFLANILQEVSQRCDLMAFLHSLCDELQLDSLNADSDIADICVRIVEPICTKLEHVLQCGDYPPALRYTLQALQAGSQGSDSLSHYNIKKFLAQSINSYIAMHLINNNRQNMESGAPCLSEQNCSLIVERVKDLFNLCFDQDLGKKLQLCLSDTAALSRSTWLITRCVDLVLGTESFISAVPVSDGPSPIAVLACMHPISGHSKALDSLLCLRPSELLFVLCLLDIGGIASSVSTTRQFAAAVSTLHNSDVMSRLSKFSTQSHGAFSIAKGSYQACTIDREVVYLIDMHANSALNGERSERMWLDLMDDTNKSSFTLSDSDAASELADSFLINASSSAMAEESRDAGSNVLSSMLWLVNVAKSTLKRVYEDPSVVAKGEATVRELTEMKDSLLAKQELIRKSAKDWEKLLQCKELCNNYKAQVNLLIDMYKGRKKAEHWKGLGGNQEDSFRYPLLISTMKEAAVDQMAMLKALGWNEQDEDREHALHRILSISCGIEDKLRDPYRPSGAVTVHNSSRFSFNTNRLSVAAGGELSAGSHGRIGKEEVLFGDSLPPTPKERPLSPPTMPVAGGMNPLWVIMQNVFRNPN